MNPRPNPPLPSSPRPPIGSGGARTPRRCRARCGLALLGALLAACAPEAPRGALLPEFRLASLAGGELGPLDLRGKVVVYDFWATWCAPCHIQAGILHELYPRVSPDGVEFVAVSVGEPESVVREFLASRPYPYPVLVDPEDRMSVELQLMGLPTVIVTDRAGRVVFRTTGIADRRELEQALARASA